MKLISLNIWGGNLYEPLMEFIKYHAADTDIFCFQEMYDTPTDHSKAGFARIDILKRITEALPDFDIHYHPAESGTHLFNPDYFPHANDPDKLSSILIDCSSGLATCVRKNIPVVGIENSFVYGEYNGVEKRIVETYSRNLTTLTLDTPLGRVAVSNFHGLWMQGRGKGDTPERIIQSEKIKAIIDANPTDKKIICGDFNLMPETKSIAILEQGMKNLIREFNVTTTRSSHYPKTEKFADYTFVSPAVEVIDFKVLSEEVSDHLAMQLIFE